MLSGRAARRSQQFGMRRKGAGWTRKFRKGREQRPDAEMQRPRVRVPYAAITPKEVKGHEDVEQA